MIPCEQCQNIIQTLSIEPHEHYTIQTDAWFKVSHENLMTISDFNNGVSESGMIDICGECFTSFEISSHISMNDDEISLRMKNKLSARMQQELAEFMVMQEKSKEITENLLKNPVQKVYATTDIFVPYTFHYETPEQVSYLPLEMMQKYGLNHPVYSVYPHISLSLEDILLNIGSNNDYVKKRFFVTFAVSADNLQIRPVPSPYGDTEIKVTTDAIVKPEEIKLLDPFTGEETPLLSLSLEDAQNRNHEEYLLNIRSKQEELSKKVDSSSFNQAVEQKLKEIQQKLAQKKN